MTADERTLLRRAEGRKRARKRRRGPYRKARVT